MARQYSKGHGKSGSSLPYVRRPSKFVKRSADDIKDLIKESAKKGLQPSKIGLILRDNYGIGLVNHYTGSRISHILRNEGLAPKLPEDLYFLIKRAVQMRKHLERNPSDTAMRYHIILVESRIYRIVRYYKRTHKLPENFKYKAKEAAALLASL